VFLVVSSYEIINSSKEFLLFVQSLRKTLEIRKRTKATDEICERLFSDTVSIEVSHLFLVYRPINIFMLLFSFYKRLAKHPILLHNVGYLTNISM